MNSAQLPPEHLGQISPSDLYPPLTPEQAKLFQQLLEQMAVVIARAEAKKRTTPALPPLSCPPSAN